MTIKPAKSEDWKTPLWLFHHFEKRFGRFDIDACASKSNSLCPSFFSKEFPFEKSELMSIEEAHIWCNPPYNAKALDAISRHIIKLSMESAAINNHLI